MSYFGFFGPIIFEVFFDLIADGMEDSFLYFGAKIVPARHLEWMRKGRARGKEKQFWAER